MTGLTRFLVVTSLLATVGRCESDLKRNLKHYEMLHASQFGHTIVKRGANPSSHPFNKIREVDFKALGRDFRLILSPKKGLLHPNFKVSQPEMP